MANPVGNLSIITGVSLDGVASLFNAVNLALFDLQVQSNRRVWSTENLLSSVTGQNTNLLVSPGHKPAIYSVTKIIGTGFGDPDVVTYPAAMDHPMSQRSEQLFKIQFAKHSPEDDWLTGPSWTFGGHFEDWNTTFTLERIPIVDFVIRVAGQLSITQGTPSP